MKKLTSIVLMILFSTLLNAQENYKDLWDKVHQHEVDNLPKSALKIVETIYQKAEKSNNSPQLVKTLLYKSKYMLTLEEDAQLKIIHQFKHHISKSSSPTKNVLENILANLYWQYFNENRWKFYDRTQTENKVDTTDFRTWDLTTLFKEIHTYYQKSLENETRLQQTNIYAFGDILHPVKDSKKYRPTLFDFLAHNALEFYKTSETHITKPIHQFKIDNPDYLSTADTFSKINITTKDEISLQYNALQLYQKLIKFHLKNNQIEAAVDADIQRLHFVYQHTTFDNKQEVFLHTLQENANAYKTIDVSGLYLYEIANIYHQQANSYQPNSNNDFRFKNKDALAICKQVIKQFPSSIGAKKCTALQDRITQKTFSILSEKFVPIQTHSRVLITYNNVEKLYFTAYSVSKNQLEGLQKIYNEDERAKFIKNLKPTTTWNSSLRNEFDYKTHTTEVIVPKLPQGNYLIVAHEEELFKTNKTYATANVQVSNLVLIENNHNGTKVFQVVDRNTGKPVKNAQLHLQNNQRRYGKSISKFLNTDKNGFATYKSNADYANVYITVTKDNDKAIFGNYYINKFSKNNIENKSTELINIKPFIFTDRSIYRPGQTVYFKAIFIKTDGDNSTPFTNEFVQITLNNVNGEEVKTLELKLNEYGSVSGEFILPNNGLTGEYSFSVDESEKVTSKFYDNANFDFLQYENIATISVEEYKRPKFETSFKPVTKTYQLNDSITVKGNATSFAGASITDATVVYRVHRKVQYPRWWYWHRPHFTSEAQEITHGELTTDPQGNFSIVFKAIPDESVSKENLPVFEYEITADVTDVNGETRSAASIVKVGYHSMLISLQAPAKIVKDNSETILSINSKNLNGQFVPAKGILKIYKLQAPKNPLRVRPWNAPDYQDISETEFRNLFPHDAYTSEEANPDSWQQGELAFEQEFNTENSKEITLKNYSKWTSGKYIAVVSSKDKFGQTVTDKARFTLTKTNEKIVSDNQLFIYNTNKTNYNADESVCLQIGSASKDITVIVQTEKNYEIVKTQLIHLNNQLKTIEIPITKEDVSLGGFAIKYYFVNYNSFVSGTIPISVVNQPKNINIETITFRDKLQPGAEETWSFTIKNDQNNKIASEVLASMYDASLDAFKPHRWQFNPISTSTYYSYGNNVNAYQSFGNEHFRIYNRSYSNNYFPTQQYDQLNWFGFSFSRNRNIMLRGARKMEVVEDEAMVEETVMNSTENDLEEVVVTGYAKEIPKPEEEQVSFEGVQIRKNLQETAFFYPHLTTDTEGNIRFSFTTPEVLTRWKLQLLAHNKELQSATKTLTAVTQKELMVAPNAPRFLREGDKITFSSKISNLSDKNSQGTAQLVLTDALTGKEINILSNSSKNQSFSVDAKGNTSVSWNLNIPTTVQAVQYKVVAKAGDFSDGEQNVLPVLSNRMLVTETLPMWVKSNQTKTFTLDKLKNQTSTTLSHHKLTLEVTSNPAWYAVQALPYLMEYPYECSEQTFARYYANTLTSHIANTNPRIKEVFDLWKSSDALLSNLEKNQELKSLIIQETPWLRDAQSETEQKKRIALLFDLNKMKNEQEKAIHKLSNMQLNNGGFPWFAGGDYPNARITNHIATGFGHLQKLGVIETNSQTKNLLQKSVNFLDVEIEHIYNKLLENAARIKSQKGVQKYEEYLKKNHLSNFIIQYLYMRSFYTDISIKNSTQKAIEYYTKQTETYWKDVNLLAKGQIALLQFRKRNQKVATKILASLKENSITSEELGMYWKENEPSWYWYQSPIETQSLLIEAFSEIEKDTEIVDNLKIWLLKNKQTTSWKTTKATTEAVYALLLQGSDWITVNDMASIEIGNKTIHPTEQENTKIEAGTGYFKTSWSGSDITPEMGTVSITKKGNGIACGGLYWQYFEDLDKITSAKTPLQLKKKLFKKVNSDTGKKLIEVTHKTSLQIGDLITVRIELRSDRDMEFVHMKDMRASGVEPINVLSEYKWQDGLGYYESTKDAATNFFFERLPKGVYVFEYDVRVNNAGDFSNGITTIQSMYAPEFSSHSKGERLLIK